MATTLTTLKSAGLALLTGCLILVGVSEARSMQGHDHGKHPQDGQATAEKTEFSGDPYLLDVDAVSGESLGPIDKQVIFEHEGRELRFASEKNAATFRRDPAKYLQTIDEKMIAQQLPFYPLAMCVVSGEELGGEMGDPINIVYKNRLVRFCCKGCKKTFTKDPSKQIAKIDKAVAEKQREDYGLTTCVVSGGKLGGMGEPIDYVIGNRLVRLCCKGCTKKLTKDPLVYLSKIDAAEEVKRSHDEAGHKGEHGDHGHRDG